MRAGPAVPPPSVLASPSRVRVPGPAARGGRCTDASRPWRCLCGLIRGSCARSPRGGRSAPLERRRGVFNASARSVDTGSSRMAGAPPGTGVGMQRRALTLPTCHPLAGAGLLPPGPQPVPRPQILRREPCSQPCVAQRPPGLWGCGSGPREGRSSLCVGPVSPGLGPGGGLAGIRRLALRCPTSAPAPLCVCLWHLGVEDRRSRSPAL